LLDPTDTLAAIDEIMRLAKLFGELKTAIEGKP
jgi:hypothetical protein